MITKHINDITKGDILALVGHAYERYNMEFKSGLDIGTPGQKKEFLADVSSFANASGGDILYGVAETGGQATALPGITTSNPDQLSLTVENLIRDGIEKRIEFAVRCYDITPGRIVLLIRVNEGIDKPHQVCYDRTSKYYARNNAGKYQLNQDEISRLFEATLRRKDQFSRFFDERLTQIRERKLSVPLQSQGLVALLLVPNRAFERHGGSSDFPPASKLLRPMGGGGHSWSFNGDGRLNSSGREHSRREAYVQIYRNGILETVSSNICCVFQGQKTLPVSESYNYERQLVDCMEEYLVYYEQVNIAFPVFAKVALIGCKDHWLAWTSMRNAFGTNKSLSVDEVTSEELIIYSAKCNVPQLLKQFFDKVWNHANWPRSFNYTEQGQWQPMR